MTLALDAVLVALRRSLPEARGLVRTEADAVALAARLLAEDPEGTRDFAGRADLLAGFLRHEAARGRPLDVAALAEPEDPTAGWLAAWDRSTALRDEFQGDREAFLAFCRHEQRCGRMVPEAKAPAPAPRPVEVRASVPPAAPEQVAPPVKLATPTAKPDSAPARRLPLAEAGTMLGLPPLDALPLTANVVAALRDCGLDPRTEGRDVTLDARAVERIAADSEAGNALLLRLCGSVRSLCHVGGGGAIAFR